jgi:hypothetical protein
MISPITSRIVGHPLRHESNLPSLDHLTRYNPEIHDIQFNFGNDYNHNNNTMILFERFWRSNGMCDIFEVAEVVRDPIDEINPSYIQRTYLIARFENAESALAFRLTIL